MAQSQRKLKYDPLEPAGPSARDKLETTTLSKLQREPADVVLTLASENPHWFSTAFSAGVVLTVLGASIYFAGLAITAGVVAAIFIAVGVLFYTGLDDMI